MDKIYIKEYGYIIHVDEYNATVYDGYLINGKYEYCNCNRIEWSNNPDFGYVLNYGMYTHDRPDFLNFGEDFEMLFDNFNRKEEYLKFLKLLESLPDLILEYRKRNNNDKYPAKGGF
jgi:hypothetical protein